MRISLRRALTALVPALVVFPGLAWADSPLRVFESPASFGYFDTQAPPAGSILAGAGAMSSSTPLAGTIENCNWDESCDCTDVFGTWRDNTLFSLGGDAYKSLADSAQPPGVATGFMDSAGLVAGFNTGFTLLKDSPIRGQIGASYGVYDWKGRDTVSQSSAEQQTFVTAGIYKRSDILAESRVCWALVYDQFWAHQWGLRAGELYVGQTRGIVGYALNENHEVGVWGTFRGTGDATTLVVGPPVRAMNQYNLYWRCNWDFGGQTMLYAGGHDPADVGSWAFGVLGQAPLRDDVALYANFTYALPGSGTGVIGSNDLEWNFGAGLVYSWGGKAVSPTVSGRKGLPLLPVANNGSFLITN
jgi:hypothetical protein